MQTCGKTTGCLEAYKNIWEGVYDENIWRPFQIADWKKEKHVPVIECPDKVKSGEIFWLKITVGKEIAHPNTTEHHIRWISVYFHPEGREIPL